MTAGMLSALLLAAAASCAQGGEPRTRRDGGPTPDAGPRPDTGMGMGDGGGPGDDGGGGVDGGHADAGSMCSPAMCSDSDMCTEDLCGFGGACSHPPVDCDDGDACTADSCESTTGCAHERPVIVGDGCMAAIDASAGGTFTGDSTCAANDAAGGCGAGDAPDIYLRIALTEASTIAVDTSGTSFDSVLSLGTSCAGGELGCDDDSGGAAAARLTSASLSPGVYYAVLDGKAGAAGGTWRAQVTITRTIVEETVSFPGPADTVSPSHGYLWTIGSYVQGTRTTTLPSATQAVIHLVIADNVLSCDSQDMRLLVNGVEAGRFSISPGPVVYDRTFVFAMVPGPTYTLRYENVRQVASGCGSAALSTAGSTVTLRR